MTVNVKYKAHYPLPEVKRLIQERAVIISEFNARRPAVGMGFTKETILECILELRAKNLLKSTEDWRPEHKGIWQDAYAIRFEERDVYIKLQIKEVGGQKLIVTSFHEQNQEEL